MARKEAFQACLEYFHRARGIMPIATVLHAVCDCLLQLDTDFIRRVFARDLQLEAFQMQASTWKGLSQLTLNHQANLERATERQIILEALQRTGVQDSAAPTALTLSSIELSERMFLLRDYVRETLLTAAVIAAARSDSVGRSEWPGQNGRSPKRVPADMAQTDTPHARGFVIVTGPVEVSVSCSVSLKFRARSLSAGLSILELRDLREPSYRQMVHPPDGRTPTSRPTEYTGACIKAIMLTLFLASAVAAMTYTAAGTRAFSGECCHPSVYNLTNILYNGAVDVEFESLESCNRQHIDGPKLLPRPNSTTFDWWYFDVVSSDPNSNASMTVIFFESTSKAFTAIADSADGFSSVVLAGVFDNGTVFNSGATASAGSDGAVLITSSASGISGDWTSTGFEFSSSGGFDEYTVRIDNSEIGVYGEMTLTSVAEPHYPCGPIESEATEYICPHVGWANAVPDSNAHVSFVVGNSNLEFTGYGYHDKNWGDQPFTESVQSWYWGHGRLGPFSLVWFDAISTDGVENYSAFVYDSKSSDPVIAASCEARAVVVRPFGNNSEYPPTPASGTPDGYTISFDLGSRGVLNVTATVSFVIVDSPVYARYSGPLTGGVVGDPEIYDGTGLWEQFKF
ncbi:hypothetical protein HK405_004902 [Cladochytrium tenue]|nr:hypothetical protein HK405_004902 [Cladochytrium tenue]